MATTWKGGQLCEEGRKNLDLKLPKQKAKNPEEKGEGSIAKSVSRRRTLKGTIERVGCAELEINSKNSTEGGGGGQGRKNDAKEQVGQVSQKEIGKSETLTKIPKVK